MAYFKIGEIDFSAYVNALKVSKNTIYNAQTNAAGNTIVDYINTKRTIEVGIIPVNDNVMIQLQNAIDAFNVSISFLNPRTNLLEENLNVIIPDSEVEYYTIQAGNVSYNGITLTFTEL